MLAAKVGRWHRIEVSSGSADTYNLVVAGHEGGCWSASRSNVPGSAAEHEIVSMFSGRYGKAAAQQWTVQQLVKAFHKLAAQLVPDPTTWAVVYMLPGDTEYCMTTIQAETRHEALRAFEASATYQHDTYVHDIEEVRT